MAEEALFDLAGKVINVLGSVIAQEVKLAFGVKTEIENFERSLSTIRAVILDAEKQSSHSHQIKDWLSKLKDVLHDADDLLDDFSTQVLRYKAMSGHKITKEVRIFFSSSNQLAFRLDRGHEMIAISERLNAIAKGKEAFHFGQSLVEPQVMNSGRETYSFVLKDEVIGRENDKEEIMKRLFDDSVIEDISIIPIVGIGGLGKTTLAQLVYNEEDVQTKFEIKLWVCISDIFDLRQIVKEIVEQLAEGKHEGSLEILQNKLRDNLKGKKYLIVLDDLWNEDSSDWLGLRNLLMVGTRGSRILVTTRSESVARIIGATSWLVLEGLPKEKAWSLFVKVAYEHGQEPKSKALVAIGKKIVKRCDGLPLVIRTIGSLLYHNTSEIVWQSFLDDELSKIGQQENKISSTLKLSYDHLPSHLKQCFAYCRLLPKDDLIDVVTLINLWAAQGFILLEDPRQRFVDIGRKYFMDLLWRSFFQEVRIDKWGNVESCKMHDFMHDLASLVSGTESARHVSFNLKGSSKLFSIPMPNQKKMHTVLVSNLWGDLGNLNCDVFISKFVYLRALSLCNLGLLVVPHLIGNLMHLRYLDLSRNGKIEILPISITTMVNLQTLILRYCRSLRKLPEGIIKLVNLRFLDMRGCVDDLTKMPLEIEHLTCLETILPGVVVRKDGSGASCSGSYEKKKAKSNGGPSQLKELHNLGGKLIVENLGYGEDDVGEWKDANLSDRQHLQQLSLRWGPWDGESNCDEMLEGLRPHPNLKALKLEDYMGLRIPSWVSSLTNLVKFHLYFHKRLQHLPPLNQLPFLKVVSLTVLRALEYISGEDSVSNVLGGCSSSSSSETPFFPSLSSLDIDGCPKLMGWWRNSDDDNGDDDNEPHHLLLPSFPHPLSELRITHCLNLTYMPPFPYLKERLTLGWCSWKVLEQTMKMEAATTSTYLPLSQLQYLNLEGIKDLESLPEEWLRNLVSLRELYIRLCDELVSLPWIGILTSLQTLQIQSCPNLTSLPQGIRNLTSLKELRIDGCHNLTSLPQEIRILTSLKELSIDGVTSLRDSQSHLFKRVENSGLSPLRAKMQEANR